MREQLERVVQTFAVRPADVVSPGGQLVVQRGDPRLVDSAFARCSLGDLVQRFAPPGSGIRRALRETA